MRSSAATVLTVCMMQVASFASLAPSGSGVQLISAIARSVAPHVRKSLAVKSAPMARGFEQYFGIRSGCVDYYSHIMYWGAHLPIHDLWENEIEVHRAGYLTDLITDRAVQYAKRQKGPFFLSLHYTAPHWPWERREDEALSREMEKLYHFEGGSVAIYAEMIRQMDEGIGKVLSVLPENTFVVFTSDNGGERFSDSWPLMGKKMDLLEGGIRVHYLARWPGRIAAGKTTAQLARAIAMSATLTCSPVDRSISISRAGGSSQICFARSTSASV